MIHVILREDPGSEGNPLPLEPAVNRNPAAVSSNDKDLRLAPDGLQLRAAEGLTVAATLHAVQLPDIAPGEDLLRRTATVNPIAPDTQEPVGDPLG